MKPRIKDLMFFVQFVHSGSSIESLLETSAVSEDHGDGHMYLQCQLHQDATAMLKKRMPAQRNNAEPRRTTDFKRVHLW